MRSKTWVAAGALVVAMGLLGRPAGAADKDKREAEVAERLITKVAGVKAGEHVVIQADVEDVALCEALELEAMQQGAYPLALLTREAFFKRYYDEVPASYDAKPASWGLKLAEQADVSIYVEREQDPGLLRKVPEERLVAVSRKHRAPYEKMLKRNVRQVALGNGLYPTKATAKKFGLSRGQLEKIFWAGVNTDYSELERRGAAVKQALAAGKELHITNPNGTDLKVGIAKRPVFVSDGVISADDLKQGGAAAQVWLPAGEVYVTPAPGTAQGTVVYDRVPFMDTEIKELKLTFDQGKLTKMEARPGPGYDKLRALYDEAPAGKDSFGAIDIGLNPDVKIPKSSKLLSWVPAGMVTVGFGSNQWAGGENTNPFGFYSFIPGSTLAVDGKPLVEKGELKLAAK